MGYAEYSQHFIFLIIYERAQYAKQFVTGKPFWFSVI